MNLQEFQALVLAEREEIRKQNLAKSQAFLATLAHVCNDCGSQLEPSSPINYCYDCSLVFEI